MAKGEIGKSSDPTLNELKKAWSELLGLQSDKVKVCMFIDGIDEYKGDFSELLGIFSSIESSSCAKAVLASRPTPECIAAFSYYRSLRLQDLTRDDIRFYVDQQLMKHPHVQDIQSEKNSPSLNFVEEITEGHLESFCRLC